ncbi:hypothetical protein QJS10_CPB12g01060 [Acorus calamus]|uniref:Uncharacterized protein n=1 Tax=Acorus calamus TaxID=4465 RepID=A0AAV9DL90_ACOCL|nr:hypothetical protein QJS10_CPB12g01060 [Acorus calamus]
MMRNPNPSGKYVESLTNSSVHQNGSEDQLNMCSINNNNNNNNGRPSKKQKQKKVPQRGLGVAQLEKLRLEEQHKSEELRNLSVVVAAPQSDHQSMYPPPLLLPPSPTVHQPQSRLIGLFKPNNWRPQHQQQQLSVITGTKRPWPFQIDGHPNLQFKFHAIPSLDEALPYPSWNPSFRQTGSSSTSNMKNKNFKENGASSTMDENSLTLTLGKCGCAVPRFGGSTNQRQYYSFLPTRETATDRETGEAKIGNIDLNLRL